MEEDKNNKTEELVARLDTFDREVVNRFAPSKESGEDQRAKVLSGEIDRPTHDYPKLAEPDFVDILDDIAGIKEEFGQVVSDPLELKAYQDATDERYKVNALMRAAYLYKTAPDDESKRLAGEEYMRLNIELFGAPDEQTYRALLADRLRTIKNKNLEGEAAELRDELFALVGDIDLDNAPAKYAPDPETMEWMHKAVETIYGPMLQHVPDRSNEESDNFNAHDVKQVFDTILTEEFGEAAAGWSVEVSETKTSIDVSPKDRIIYIPINKNFDTMTVKGLVVHELGIHVMRSIMGEQNELAIMRTGMSGYYTSEEGLGQVMEQALRSKFDVHIPYYTIAGGAYFDGKQWPELFRTETLMSTLEKIADGNSDIDQEEAAKQKRLAYLRVQRIERGTDELPLFKDLAYYNGAVNMWKLLDTIRGNTELLTMILYGKQDFSDESHRQILLTSRPNMQY